jgi:hypothetical protein
MFKSWLDNWNYDVELGHTLTGLRGIEFIPDVYGQLVTLHGEYEICINFVCDDPPDEDRINSLLYKIEAYAEAKRTFSAGDIFIIVTQRRFTKGSMNAIGLHNEQENYSVFGLDGGDIFKLEKAETKKDRLLELKESVDRAQEDRKRNRHREKNLHYRNDRNRDEY